MEPKTSAQQGRVLAASPCSAPEHVFGYRITLQSIGLTKAKAIAQAVRVLVTMMEEPHTNGYSCGSNDGNASAKLDVIP